MKRFIILGSTGSIGRSSIDVVSINPDHFRVAGLTAASSVERICAQVKNFRPEAVAMEDAAAAAAVQSEVGGMTRVLSGAEGILELVRTVEAEAVVNGLVGSAGMLPTLAALESGKDVLLANKETMVMAGEIVMAKVRETGRRIVPIDSEMSAIYQCLNGENPDHVKRLVLTASGGPFVDASAEDLERVTVEQALNHPTWSMGTKNTIDSATLMNKGLEIIEASRLFDIPGERIDVTIHRSSVAHSLVEFVDGSVMAQLSEPDMRLAIQYAMTAPERLPSPYGSLDFLKPFSLVFEPPDFERFPCLAHAFEALERGGTATAALNGANERAVEAFVAGAIPFMDIPRLIRRVVDEHVFVADPGVEDLVGTDREAKRRIERLMGN